MKALTYAIASAACVAMIPTSAAATTFVYNGTGGALPDLVDFTSTITVPDNFIIEDVNFTLNNLTHTFWADLEISLSQNALTSVLAADDNGSSSNPNGDFTFDDEALVSITNVNTAGGAFRPLDPLSAFDGNNAAGAWTLRIRDDAGADSGNLGSWTLTLTGTQLGAVPEPGTWAMMLMGFGGIGFSMRKARRAQVILQTA